MYSSLHKKIYGLVIVHVSCAGVKIFGRKVFVFGTFVIIVVT